MLLKLKNDTTILNELSTKLKKYRLNLNLSQDYICRKTGMSIHTISNIENCKSFTVENLIKYLRTLNLLDNFEQLVPEIKRNPEDVLNNNSPKKRVREKENNTTWEWGD